MSAGKSILARWSGVGAGVLLICYVVLANSAAGRKSSTFDEGLHVTTGYFYWTHPEKPLWPENGVFAQAWAALPLLTMNLSLTPGPGMPPKGMGPWEQGYRFLHLSGNDPAAILVRARFMISLLAAALGWLVFQWSRELFGADAGLVSVLLFVLCPTILAHGALVTADMAACLGFFAATCFFWKLSHRVTLLHLAASLLALACLVLSKMSALLIAPVFGLILLVRICSRRPVEILLPGLPEHRAETRRAKAGAGVLLIAVHAAAAVGLLWLAYRFNHADWGEAAYRRRLMASPEFALWSGAGMKIAGLEFLDRRHLLPAAYLEGLSYVLHVFSRGGFLLGKYNEAGSAWFFPVAFLLKTPVATLLLLLLAMAVPAMRLWPASRPPRVGDNELPGPGLYDLSPLLILGGVYGLVCLTSRLNIGHRHMLPVYPVLFVLAGANIHWGRRFGSVAKIAAMALLGGVLVESFAVRPHYLAFFNAFAGGPRHGYRYLVDSSLDWGQDLPGLRQWLDRNAPAGGGTRVYLSYFGTGDPGFYGITALRLPSRFNPEPPPPAFDLQAGVYCLSATTLQAAPPWTPEDGKLYAQTAAAMAQWDATARDPESRSALLGRQGATYWASVTSVHRRLQFIRLRAYLLQREPDDNVGYSILIYRLSDEDLKQALRIEDRG